MNETFIPDKAPDHPTVSLQRISSHSKRANMMETMSNVVECVRSIAKRFLLWQIASIFIKDNPGEFVLV